MSPCGVLTLLSDFGLSDAYVGVMKGTIVQIQPTLTIIDLTHQIPPQNLWQGRFALMSAVPYFPAGTVHVAVVDPGVGGTRRAVAVALAANLGYLVGPDNGLLSGAIAQFGVSSAVELTNPYYWRAATPSSTFHGRDIFAPVGAHLARGVPLAELGRPVDPQTLLHLDLPVADQHADQHQEQQTYRGCIQAIDHFGNLITTIPSHAVSEAAWSVTVAGREFAGQRTYGDRAPGELLALIGSHGWVEIAVSNGSAHEKLGIGWGERVDVMVHQRGHKPESTT